MQQHGDTYNRGGFIAFLFSMVFSLAFFIYVCFMIPAIDLKEVPAEAIPAAEGGLAANGGTPAVDVSKIEKPWEASDPMSQHGATLYATNCTACHGPKGMGDGPAGKALVPPPRNFVEGKWKKGGDSASLFKTITTGIPGTSMAPFGHLPVKDRWALVQFIRSITKNKVADDAKKLEEFAKTAK
jgi:mono/diheme cytochrome c family protein